MSVASAAFARVPLLEVLARSVYFRLPEGVRKRGAASGAAPGISADRALEALDSLAAEAGLPLGGEGRILLVHSSYDAISACRTSPKTIVERLREAAGAGTLAMPAIPMFKEEPDGSRDLWEAPPVCTYDPRRTPPWTGLLPYTLMRTPGAIRSQHPHNAMVALGPDAEPIMRHNLDGADPLPHGTGSSWAYCYEHDATVAFLGADPVDSISIIHVAEDLAVERGLWPVPDWYRRRRYRLKTGDGTREIVIRERQPRYRLLYLEQALDRDLRSRGILHGRSIDGVPFGVASARAVVDFLLSRAERGYPFGYLGLRNVLTPRPVGDVS